MKVKNKLSIWILLVLLSVGIVSSIDVQFSDQGSDVRDVSDDLVNNGDLTIQVWDSANNGSMIYEENFTNKINEGKWNLIVGESGGLDLEYGVEYWKDYQINGQDLDFNSSNGSMMERLPFRSSLGLVNYSYLKNFPIGLQQISSLGCSHEDVIMWNGTRSAWQCRNKTHDINGTEHIGNLSSIRVVKDTGTNFIGELLDYIIDTLYSMITNVQTNVSVLNVTVEDHETRITNVESNVTVKGPTFLNLTTSTYNGNITNGSYSGYAAANIICDQTFADTHLCTEFEVVFFISNSDFSYLNTDAWIIAGGPKYVPANIPVNDCNGWQYGTTPSYLGNYWKFNNQTGGKGAAINCATTIPLACCK